MLEGGNGVPTYQPMPSSSATYRTDPNFMHNTVTGMANTAWGTAANLGALKGDQLNAVGYDMAAKASSLMGGTTTIQDAQQMAQYGQTGESLASAVAPGVNGVHDTALGLTRTFAPMAQEVKDDAIGLKLQAAAAAPSAVHSMLDGAAGAVSTVTPYISGAGNPNNLLGLTSNAVQQAGQAAQTVMHNTVVPMASDGLKAAANLGGSLSSGFSEGFGEGYTAAMDRRVPYQDGPTVQQQFEGQPAVYLPSSFEPLGAMATITYPCPTGPQNSIAPVGTIVGPGIPCGVQLQVVPRSAVPTNRFAPPVVIPVPVAAPVSGLQPAVTSQAGRVGQCAGQGIMLEV